MKKGFTLIEVLVAVVIFALVLVAALQVYDRSQRSYVLGQQMSDVQQGVRFAFEKISQELKVAGYQIYPDPNAQRPDMPLEGMWSGAVAIRAAFAQGGARFSSLECTPKDSSTKQCSSGASGAFNLVTTQNSDIHIYVLAKQPGTSVTGSNETLKFKVDLSAPRAAVAGSSTNLEMVVLPGISLAQDSPPYTLYMVTVQDGITISAGGTVQASQLTWTPIASNIFSMQFNYYNQNGINTTDAITADNADISTLFDSTFRSKHGWPFASSGGTLFAKNVTFRLVGMTAQADAKFTDRNLPSEYGMVNSPVPAAFTAAVQYRKYQLTSTVNLVDAGVAPHELADTTPPGDPSNLASVKGYCNGVLLTWTPPPATTDLASYTIQTVTSSQWSTWGSEFKYGCDDAPTTCSTISTPEVFSTSMVGTFLSMAGSNGSTYYSRVYAVDTAGNLSRNPTNAVSFTVTPDPIKPLAPVVTGAAGNTYSGDGTQRLFVTYNPPTQYDTTQNASCVTPPGPTGSGQDPHYPVLRDLFGYQLYDRRMPSAAASDFTPNSADQVATESTPSGNPMLVGTVSYPDLGACPCEFYAFKMKAVTSCTSANDNTTLSPPCLHTSEYGAVSMDSGNNPVAYAVPYPQALTIYPQIVPAVLSGSPSENSLNTSGSIYTITLGFHPVLTSSLKNSDGTFTTPNPNTNMAFEVWKYKIWRYDVDPSVNPSATATLIPYSGSQNEWDAEVNASPNLSQLTSSSVIYFAVPNQTIASGTYKWYAVSGTYKCTDAVNGTTYFDGPISPAVKAPGACSTWTASISDPAMDYALIVPTTYTIKVSVSGMPTGTTITGATIDIGGGTTTGTMTVTNSNPTASATYAWNATGYADGNYLVKVTLTDSATCFTVLQRWVTISSACSGFTFAPTLASTKMHLQLTKTDDTTYYIVNSIGFISQNYLTSSLDYYESNPTSGSPTAINLWTGTAVDFNGKSVGRTGSGATYIQNHGNLSDTNATNRAVNLHHNYQSGTIDALANWFTLTLNKAVSSGNGTLNLFESYNLKKCDTIYTNNVSIAKNGANQNFTVPTVPVCSWKKTNCTGNTLTFTVTNDTGAVTASCASGAACACTFTAYSPGTAVSCTNIPVYMGP